MKKIAASAGELTGSRRKAAVRTAETLPQFPPVDRQRWVAEAAFYISESRGFAPGQELDDWLAAEAAYALADKKAAAPRTLAQESATVALDATPASRRKPSSRAKGAARV